MSAPTALTEVAPRVTSRLIEFLDLDAKRWLDLDPLLAAPLAALRRGASEGKRLRATWLYWSYVGAGGSPAGHPSPIDAGVAVELLHASALIHDDVIDSSLTRHGAPTAHRALASEHRDAGWHGDPSRFGAGAAILVGDIAYVYSDMLLADATAAARRVFDDLRLEVNIGQYLDHVGTARRSGDVGEAHRICRYKTAKYTVERPLHLGAALAAQDRLSELQPGLSAYALPLGEAFQLRDDLLGIFGDPAVTGKRAGEDIVEGKPTMLYALAHQAATGASAQLLADRYGAADISDDDIARLQAVFEETGARRRTEQLSEELADQALEAVEALPLTTEAVAALGELARFAIDRDH